MDPMTSAILVWRYTHWAMKPYGLFFSGLSLQLFKLLLTVKITFTSAHILYPQFTYAWVYHVQIHSSMIYDVRISNSPAIMFAWLLIQFGAGNCKKVYINKKTREYQTVFCISKPHSYYQYIGYTVANFNTNTWTLTKHSGHPCWVKSGLLWSWRGMHNAISEFIFGEEDCQHLNGIFAHIFGRCWQTQEVYLIVHLQTRNGWVRLTGYHMDKIILLSAISYRKLFYLYNFLKTTDVRENICNKTSKN